MSRWSSSSIVELWHMWSFRSEALADARGLRLLVSGGSRLGTFADVVEGWQNDAGFRSQFNAILAGVQYRAFRWESPAVVAGTMSRPFECVVLDSPELDRPADPRAFSEYFLASARDVVTFPNLGRNAVMVVPCPVDKHEGYGHLASFVRSAPEPQRHALWRAVGDAMAVRVGAKPVWLSTAGAGVAWLHVRLDDAPKYYGFAPYRRAP